MEPSDPHNLHDTADHEVIDRIQIATAGNDCDECVRKLRDPLMRIEGVQDVKADPAAGYVTITFDRRRTQAAELHEAILQSGYQAASLAG
jgi:copper chaperone CopZ